SSARATKKVNFHTKIRYRLEPGRKVVGDQGEFSPPGGIFETSVGRVIFNDVIPPAAPFFNLTLSKKTISRVIYDCHRRLGREKTLKLLDDIKELGFKVSTLAGLSFSKNDLVMPSRKDDIIQRTQVEVERIESNYKKGIITDGERYNQIIDAWTHARERIGEEMMQELRNDTREGVPYLNPVYIMATSGARGSIEQIRQLAGMRGLMAKPSGKIIETPI